MKKTLYLLLCTALIIAGLSGCTSDDRKYTVVKLMPTDISTEMLEEPPTMDLPTEIIPETTEEDVMYNRFKEQQEIFSNPKIDVNTRIETFLQSNFGNYKIDFFDNFDNINEDLNYLILNNAIHNGSVYRTTGKIGDGLTKEMIDANIIYAFGDIISKLDFSSLDSSLDATYDDELEIYVPGCYGAPGHVLYVFHNIENVNDNIYKTVVSYIGNEGDLLAFDLDGEWTNAPEYIHEMTEQSRGEATEEFIKYIKENPGQYERTELFLEIGDDYIRLLSAKKYTD